MKKSVIATALAMLMAIGASPCLGEIFTVKSNTQSGVASGTVMDISSDNDIEQKDKLYLSYGTTEISIDKLGVSFTLRNATIFAIDDEAKVITFFMIDDPTLMGFVSPNIDVEISTRQTGVTVAATRVNYPSYTWDNKTIEVPAFTSGTVTSRREANDDRIVTLNLKQSIGHERNPFEANDDSLFGAFAKVLRANNDLDFEGNPLNLGGSGGLPLGAVTAPVAAAIAAGDFPFAGALDSYTLSSQGALTAFSAMGGLDSGSTTSASVCASTACTAPATIRWGAWGQGSAQISGSPVTVAPTAQLHYLLGNATAPAVIDARTGTVAFNHLGGTTPTGADGTNYTATVGNVSVNFTAATATLSQYTLAPTLSPATTSYDFRNVALTVNPTTPGDQAKTLFGTATGQAPGATTGNLVVNGFFAGATGDHIGAALNVTDSANTALKINSVQAFKQQ